MASSSLESSDEKIYGFKLMRLIIDGGTEQLRNVFSSKCPGWNVMPSSTDTSLEADIVRIRLFRNNFFGHVSGTDITRLDFEVRWAEVSSVLLRQGLSQAEIDRLKTEECGENEVNRVRTEWKENEKEFVRELSLLRKKIDESIKQVKSSTKDFFCECLDQYDFKEEIESFYHNYTEGTREWVFDQVSIWLNDKLSDNRAFIISGQAGMGKSTIAAVICKRFPEYFGACHFFQYNNSRYNNPKFLLNSLASQLCLVIPKYKQNLANNLSGNKAQSLNEQNIEGMFSILFTEQFSNIPDPGKLFLIVIDALDECRQDEKHKLVDLITQHFHKFPKFIRFLITTRSESDIARKFQRLNPVFLLPDDEWNLNDLRLYFERKLKTILEEDSREELVKQLVVKSDGLMLYASFLCKLTENGQIVSNDEDLPVGIEEIYDRYFKRLEGELKKISVDSKQFLKFLSVITVSKQPLPLALIERLFSTDRDLTSAGRTLGKLIDCLSSLLIFKDESLLFFHKSVRDWLVKPNHEFTIIERHGHRALADICISQIHILKQNEPRSKFDLPVVYALQYGIQHIVEAQIEDINSLTKLINPFIDLEVVYASVCIDVYSTLTNLSLLQSDNIQNSSVFEETQTTIEMLISLLKKFGCILKDIPQSFLQHVVNEGDGLLSSQATALLMTRYKGLAYFELKDRNKNTGSALIGRTITENRILEIDISPAEDLLICGYEEGVELFSLPYFKSLWKIEGFVLENISVETFYNRFPLRRIVFHPRRNVIFPGQLTPVLNFEGKFESGRIICGEIPNKFTTSCFSHDTKKMVTNYGAHLTVWNLLENKKIVSLPCRSELASVLFSANDRFIGTTNVEHELCVYDSQNSYSMISKSCSEGTVLVSTCYSDSWFSSDEKCDLLIVRNDFKSLPVTSSLLAKIYPANARAAPKFQEQTETDFMISLFMVMFTFFGPVSHSYVYFNLSNESYLLYCKFGNLIKLVGPNVLDQALEIQRSVYPEFLSFLYFAREFSFSIDGKYIYAFSTMTDQFSIMDLTSPRAKKSTIRKVKSKSFFPVKNSVFISGEIRKSFRRNPYFYPGIPQLWNFGVTKRFTSFPELTGTYNFVSVTQDLVACIGQSQVYFFNVLKNEIVAREPFPEHILKSYQRAEAKLIACSSLYHVLIGNTTSIYLLENENCVDLDSRINITSKNLDYDIIVACFSPNGKSLAIRLGCDRQMLYILGIATLDVRGKFSLFPMKVYSFTKSKLEFVDDEHLIFDGYDQGLCLISVKTCDILTSINLSLDYPLWSVFSCRSTVGIAYADGLDKFGIIKLWLPQQRKNENELLECSCLIHGRNLSELDRNRFNPSCSII